jgi:8-oxo-dGTP pyrophosphatase MutT (NUDIX family)
MVESRSKDVSLECWKEWISKKAVANAGVVVVNSHNQALMLFKQKYGEWEIPSGGIDIDEEPIETAIRELEEEAGIQLHRDLLREMATITAFHPNDKTDIITTFLACPVFDNTPITLSNEHTKFKWLPLQEHSNENIKMHEATRKQLKMAYESRNGKDVTTEKE